MNPTGYEVYLPIDHAHEGYRCPGATLALRGGYSVGLILRRSEGIRVGRVP